MKLWVAGTRDAKITYAKVAEDIKRIMTFKFYDEFIIIEGCCKGSADELAEHFAKENNVQIIHFPATEKNYIKRNVDMAKACDTLLAYWDGYSYGTSHSIAQAVMRNKNVRIIPVHK